MKLNLNTKKWLKTVNDEYIATGGGFNYYITFYIKKSNPLKQIEILQEVNNYTNKRLRTVSLNIGTRYDYNLKDKWRNYEFIQGDYSITKEFKTKTEAIKFIKRYMEA